MTPPNEKAKKQYQKRLKKAKSMIDKYDKSYFIAHCINHICSIKRSDPDKFNFEFVWILAIKISALSTGGKRKPNHREIVGIINSLWDLNNCIIPFLASDNNPMVALRAMTNQQSTYQNNITVALANVSRQLALLADEEELDKQFIAETGISIAAYCWIWMHILVQILNHDEGSLEINIPKLILDTEICISIADIYKFFKVFSIHTDEMPSFFSNFTAYDTDFESFFYDSPLKQKPFLFTGNSIRTISSNLTIASASFLLPHLFKSSNSTTTATNFKKIFTRIFEDHIGDLLLNTRAQHRNEDDIRDLYRSLGTSGKRSNVVDHSLTITETKKILLVESKGVEQTDFVKTILDQSILTRRLEGSHLKGIVQAQQCTEILSKHEEFTNFNFYAFIIVNDDYGFSSAAQLQSMIGLEAFTSTIPAITISSSISLDRIRFVKIDTLEKICSSIQDSEYTLDLFLEKSNEPEFRYSLDLLHHKLTKTHPASSIQKIIHKDSPHITKLTTLAMQLDKKNHTIAQLVTDANRVILSLKQHKQVVYLDSLRNSPSM